MIVKSFESCGKCDKRGYIIGDVAKKCPCRKQWESKTRFMNILLKSGMISDYSTDKDVDVLDSYSFNDYIGLDTNKNIDKLKKFVENFSDKAKPYYKIHQYWYGIQGSQKTYTAKGLLSLLAKQNQTVYYIFAKDLIALIMQSERDEEKAKSLNYIQNVDCLVIDELQEDRMALYSSGYKQNVFTPWLKMRLETIKKSTIFLSNDTLQTLQDNSLGDLLFDFINRETKFAQFTFNDNYIANCDKSEFENQLKSIWE